jgi:signal transduction histidine kinase
MEQIKHDSGFDWIVNTYFSDPAYSIYLKKGDVLMQQDSYNNRLYLVLKGCLQGYVMENGKKKEIFRALPNTFAGAYSFFSKKFNSIATLAALEDTELRYITRNQFVHPSVKGNSLEQQFMPVIVADLMIRQQQNFKISSEKEQALNSVMEHRRMASLGQMAAGIAHEINNAISVLSRSTQWIIDHLHHHWLDKSLIHIFEAGLLQGRIFSSREKRERKKAIKDRFQLDTKAAGHLAQTNLTIATIEHLKKLLPSQAEHIYETWELGATFNDMQVAANQSAHVVKSMKTMGAQHLVRKPKLRLNETILNALALLRHKIKPVALNLNLNDLPNIEANAGELVQAWVNLIKNACEAMLQNKKKQAELSIISEYKNSTIVVVFADNGPGIPNEMKEKIFQPNITTKVKGLSFGLGLGLPIVLKIIKSYSGSINVESSSKGTIFTIKIPVGGKYAN